MVFSANYSWRNKLWAKSKHSTTMIEKKIFYKITKGDSYIKSFRQIYKGSIWLFDDFTLYKYIRTIISTYLKICCYSFILKLSWLINLIKKKIFSQILWNIIQFFWNRSSKFLNKFLIIELLIEPNYNFIKNLISTKLLLEIRIEAKVGIY